MVLRFWKNPGGGWYSPPGQPQPDWIGVMAMERIVESNCTVARLKRELEEIKDLIDDDAEVYFSGLRFNRLHVVGKSRVHLEFVETLMRNQAGRLEALDSEDTCPPPVKLG
jgi:hypothetical protein